jgi:membrane-bound metal-dependent hydrolase YbcI (DUF457 family)
MGLIFGAVVAAHPSWPCPGRAQAVEETQMANFTTHIGAGTIVAGALATLTLAADVVAPENLVAVTLAGVLGSILPDIDLRESRPSRAMFAGLAVFFSFAVLFNVAMKYSIAELWIVWLGTLVGVRYGLHYVFHKISVHRGIWHSLLAGAFCSILTAIVFHRLLGRPEGVAWLAAGFMMIGYLTHLVLDEIYSVDVMDVRIKASFGTAVKLFDSRYPAASLAMAAATAAAVMVSPPTKMFVDGVSSKSLWAGLQSRLLPSDKWFGLVNAHPIASAQKTSDITTGSIPEAKTAAVPATAKTNAPARAISDQTGSP